MNDDKISFKNTMLIFISNNFHLWIEELKSLILKIKIWKYINSYDKIKKSRKKILSEIDHFVVKQSDFTLSTMLTILSQIKLINLLNLHNLESRSIFLSWRLSNKKIIEQMWKNTNEEKNKSLKSFKEC
jgi:uncharacterized membrane protein YciS (DUF1049 family)